MSLYDNHYHLEKNGSLLTTFITRDIARPVLRLAFNF
ncbi:Uncharacterised protein [Yersinia intermedia]|nr:Uncharacterised protein [Yersinia intermedia]